MYIFFFNSARTSVNLLALVSMSTICFDNIHHEILFDVLWDVIWLWRNALCRSAVFSDFIDYDPILLLQKFCSLYTFLNYQKDTPIFPRWRDMHVFLLFIV
jgi:hypothetical protein